MTLRTVTVDIEAGSQFTGLEREFLIAAGDPRTQVLRLIELDLMMGQESKVWKIYKRDADNENIALLQQSTTDSGVPSANTDESVILIGKDIETLLAAGEKIIVETTGATGAMRARLYFREEDIG